MSGGLRAGDDRIMSGVALADTVIWTCGRSADIPQWESFTNCPGSSFGSRYPGCTAGSMCSSDAAIWRW